MKNFSILTVAVVTISFFGFIFGGERVVIDEGKISIELPDGWKKSERNSGTTLIGWESSDQKASAFVQRMVVDTSVEMTVILERIVDRFDENEAMEFEKVGEFKTGQVQGTNKKYPAIFTTLEATLKAKPKDFEMKFYLFVFDAGETQYFIQASSTKPIWDVREKQIMSLIRSIVVK